MPRTRKPSRRSLGPAGDPPGSCHIEQFGSGVLYAKPVEGNPVGPQNPPMRIGKLEEVKVTMRLPSSAVQIERDQWNEDRWKECGGGIHFYLTKIEAENHS